MRSRHFARLESSGARSAAAATTALALALLQLGPLLGRGYVLDRDMVFVPKLPLNDTLLGVSGGAPRAVPSDLVVALLSRVVPGDIVQDLILLFVIAVGGWGAGRLLSRSVVGAVSAAALYSWNPYLTEHLLLGQWAILLGYAALPWIAGAALGFRDGESGALPRLVGWLGIAAIGGASAELLAALVVIPILGWPAGGYRAVGRRVGVVLLGLGVVALPWLIPALTQPGGTPADRVGVQAFASHADTPFGTFGSLLSLGGVWNVTAVPPGRSHWYAAGAALAVTGAAMWGLARLWRERGPATGGGLAAVGGVGLALALWAHIAGVDHALRWLASHSQAFDLLRDGQRSLAPFVLVVAIGWGSAVAEVAAEARRAAVLAGVPLMLLPAAAWGVSGKLAAVSWPGDWNTVATAAGELPPGPVLVLPWASVRAYPWNDNRPMTDPANRWLHQRVVGDGRLFVRLASGAVVSTVEEDSLARAIGATAAGNGPLTAQLRSRGYAGVLVERNVGGGVEQAARLRGARLVSSTPTLTLYAVPRTNAHIVNPKGSVSATLVGDVLALLAVTTAGTISAFSAVQRRRSV